jgi:hypothetical protein
VERVEVQRQGATAVKAVVGAFGLQRLRFAGGHSIPWFEPEWGYLAIVLDGTMQKTFSSATWSLPRDSFATLPPGAGHSTAFGVKPTHVLTLYPTTDESALLIARFLWERRQIIAPGSATLGRRLALELDAADTSWGLAAEGLVLQVLAMGSIPAIWREPFASGSASRSVSTRAACASNGLLPSLRAARRSQRSHSRPALPIRVTSPVSSVVTSE